MANSTDGTQTITIYISTTDSTNNVARRAIKPSSEGDYEGLMSCDFTFKLLHHKIWHNSIQSFSAWTFPKSNTNALIGFSEISAVC